MTANIWKDDELMFWSIEISLSNSRVSSSARQWEGSFCILGGDRFDVRGRYRLGLDDGKSADIVLTHVLRRKPTVVHFRVLAWKNKPIDIN